MGSLMIDDPWDEATTERTRPEGARILVVDDDGAMREVVAVRLMNEGFDVHEAASGTELLGVLRTSTTNRWPMGRVDLIVLDNRMPGMTGLEAIQKLRAAHCDTPAILMTAFPDGEVRIAAQALGVPLLPKPFSLDLLMNAVRAVLRPRNETADGSQASR